ncbi:MAG TPA: SCO family protein [Solirubrobacter sp.]|nr:SCO family protein [Solirubrobacter sp.]
MRRFLVAAALCLVLGGLGGLLAAAVQPAPAPARYRFVPPREPAFDFRLNDQDGHAESIRAARGNVLVLTFLYSTCRDLCPAQASLIAQAVGRAGGRGILVYGVSVDPVGDTPERAREFLRSHGLPTSVVKFLVGSRAQLAPVWRAYGIAPINATPEEAEAAAEATDRLQRAAARSGTAAKPAPYAPPARDAPPGADQPYPDPSDLSYRGRVRHEAGLDFEHSAYVMLIDKHGRQRVGIPFEQLDVDGLAADLEALLREP